MSATTTVQTRQFKSARALFRAAQAAWRSLTVDWAATKGPELTFPDILEDDLQRLAAVDGLTMTSTERRYMLLQAVRHLCRHQIPGDIVECGVWRGGSMMLAARTLIESGSTHRHLYLYDTFAGMPAPGDMDCDARGTPAQVLMARDRTDHTESELWAEAPLADVQRNLSSTGYPPERLHLIAGRVENTIPDQAPEQIALLRLDTDWYESTAHELAHLYPRVVRGGIVIIDDYGYWRGARQAVDEFIQRCPDALFLMRIDNTGRLFLKP